MFAISDPQGKLSVAKQLDRETKAEYRFEVVASDSKSNQTIRKSTRSEVITVVITDIDDNPPIFTSVVPQEPAVPESLPVNQTIATVVAEDADDKNTENGLVL